MPSTGHSQGPPSGKPGGRSLSGFDRECVAFFAELVQVVGVPKSVGQIYGLLYASPGPLSFSDILGRLDISKGSVSQGLQFLRSLGAINVARAAGQAAGGRGQEATSVGDGDGSRRVAYEPELGLRRLVSGVLRERVLPLATARGDRLSRLRELAERDGEARDFLLARVKQLETWRRRFKTVLPVLSALLGPKR